MIWRSGSPPNESRKYFVQIFDTGMIIMKGFCSSFKRFKIGFSLENGGNLFQLDISAGRVAGLQDLNFEGPALRTKYFD